MALEGAGDIEQIGRLTNISTSIQWDKYLNNLRENIARIANAVTITQGLHVNVNIVVLNCQKCNQCLKCQESIFWKSENFPKIWKFSGNLKILRKSKNFLEIWKFSENLKIFRKSENFLKIYKNSENLKIFRNLRSGRHSDHMSQGSQVCGIAPQLSVRSWRRWCQTDRHLNL